MLDADAAGAEQVAGVAGNVESEPDVAARGTALPLDCVWEPSVAIGSTHAVLLFSVETRILAATANSRISNAARIGELVS